MAKKRGNRPRRKCASGDFMKELRPRVASLQTEISRREDQLSLSRSSMRRIENILESKIIMLEYKPVGDNELAVVGDSPDQRRSQNKTGLLGEELAKLRKDRDHKWVEIKNLTAELQEVRVALARVEIDEWRSIRSTNFLGRLFRQLGRIFSKFRSDLNCFVEKGRFRPIARAESSMVRSESSWLLFLRQHDLIRTTD